MNIPISTLICTGLVGVLCAAGPIAAAFWLYRKKTAPVSAFLWGAGVYLLFGLALQRTFVDLIALTPLVGMKWFVVLYSALSTAGAVCCGLLICFAWVIKDDRTMPDALMAGVGYGWCEAFFLLGIDMLYTTAFGNAIRREPQLFAGEENAEVFEAMAQQLAQTDVVQLLLVGLAQLAAAAMVPAIAALVMTTVRWRRPIWFIIAFVMYFACAALCVLVGGSANAALLQAVIQLAFTALTTLLARGAYLSVWQDEEPPAPGTVGPATVTVNAPLKRRKL